MGDNDRRVRKTERALRTALAELITKKELRHITVQELADRADVHRATFYLHYQDVYDLYEQTGREILSRLREIISEDTAHSYELLFTRLIDYLYDNPELSRMLFAGGGETATLQAELYSQLEQKYIDIWRYEVPGIVITDEMHYIVSYHIQGFFSLVSSWIRQNFSAPKEDIIKLLRMLDNAVDNVIDRLRAAK